MDERQRRGGRLRLVRPLLGTAAALALVVGGATAFTSHADPGPTPQWSVNNTPYTVPLQTNHQPDNVING
ncbi:hypothetical protein ACFYV7_24120 [Nocardia suismassiliense]|uniref:Uncharacterized protein n=1 Tax=Nocardia suismassiliense TaxID=2077092 RepID=A0ABW6QZC8_9NOCA|nr:hypothetical protein [Nocardia sp. XZ_19_369]